MMYELTSKFLSKLKIGVVYTILVFAVLGVVDSVLFTDVPVTVVFLYVLLPVYIILFLLEVLWRVGRRLRGFSGQIRSHKDVDDFLSNYKYFIYLDGDVSNVYKHLVLNSVVIIVDGCRFKILTPGVYAWSVREGSDFIFNMIKVGSCLDIDDFVWEDRRYINAKLRSDV